MISARYLHFKRNLALTLIHESRDIAQFQFGLHLLLLATKVDEFGSDPLKDVIHIEKFSRPAAHLIMQHSKLGWNFSENF